MYSDTMRDVEMELWVDGDTSPGDRAAFTVLTAEQPTVAFSDDTSTDNDKRNNYRDWTAAKHYQLGMQTYTSVGSLYDDRIGPGVEASSTIWPEDFDYPGVTLVLHRDVDSAAFTDSNATPYWTHAPNFPSIPPGNDTGPSSARDENPNPDNRIYNFDAAGWPIATEAVEVVRRYRGHFRVFASASVGGTAVRISPVRDYYVAVSCRRGPTGTSLVDPPDVTGDNYAGYTSIPLSWNVQ